MDWIGKSWMVKGILSFVGFVAVLAVTQSLLAAILAMALVSWLVIFFYDIPRAKEAGYHKDPSEREKKYNTDGGMLSAVMLPDYVIGHSDDPASGHGKNSGRCSTRYLWISCSTHNDRSDGSIPMYLTRLLRCLPNSTAVEISGISGKPFANVWQQFC